MGASRGMKCHIKYYFDGASSLLVRHVQDFKMKNQELGSHRQR